MVKKTIFQIIGIILIALGVALIITSELGAFPLDAINVFINELSHNKISIGTVAIIQGFLFTLLAFVFLRKKLFLIGAILSILSGSFIDIWKIILAYFPNELGFRILYSIIGLNVLAIGTVFTIITGFPPLPVEQLLLSINKKINNLGKSKVLLESIFLVFAIIIGLFVDNPFTQLNILTPICVLTLGPLVNLYKKPISKILKMSL